MRSDGTTLYLTKDLALARQKFEKYHVDRSVYVVDSRQSLHLQQAFAILKLWGFPQADKCFHLGCGFVTLPEAPCLHGAATWPSSRPSSTKRCEGVDHRVRSFPR
jgi:arginyl-tRNA synthetase